MDEILRRRILPLLAFIISLTTLALALTTLLAGITGSNSKSAAILTLNTSSLGLGAYHDPASPLHANITALMPPDVTKSPSITQYIGAYDWYSMHYFSNCSGFFAPSTINPSILTSDKVNITCHRQYSGYPFNLHSVVQSTLHPSIQDLADTVSTYQYQTSTWSGLWYGGIGNLCIAGFELPWTFMGERPWLNFWIWWNAFIATVLFMSSSAMVTNTIITVNHAKGLPGPNPWSGTFLGIMWSTTVLMACVFALMWVQWRFEGGAKGHCYGQKSSRREGGEIPLEDWKSDNTAVGSKLS